MKDVAHFLQFIDLSAQVHAVLLERFSELRNPPPYDDPSENLPMPSISALDWQADALVDLDENETETDDPDWDDVAILIGSEIVRGVRAAIRAQLQYTCSAVCLQNHRPLGLLLTFAHDGTGHCQQQDAKQVGLWS